MAKIVKYIDKEDEQCPDVKAGILLDDGNLICACCGGLFEKDDQGETWDILEEYDYWPDMTEFILS